MSGNSIPQEIDAWSRLPIELLVISPSEEAAVLIAQQLRNARVSVHLHQASSLDAVAGILDRQSMDVVLCLDYEPSINTPVFLDQQVKRNEPSAFVIIADDKANEDILLRLLKTGARDLVSKDDVSHLTLVVQRERNDTRIRRRLIEVLDQLDVTESRCRMLLANAQECIAYLYQGMHINANGRYAQLLGFNDPEELVGVPVLDYAGGDNAGQLKEALRHPPSAGETLHLEMELTDAQGKTFAAELSVSRAQYEGEECVQILAQRVSHQTTSAATKRAVADVDPDTQLPSRNAFIEQLDAVLNSTATGALLHLQLDKFAALRTQLGMGRLPGLMADLATQVREALPNATLLGRLGDDSFTLYLAIDPQVNALHQLAEQLHAHIAKASYHDLDASEGPPTLSLGIAIREPDSSALTLIDRALMASLKISEEGGNNSLILSPDSGQSNTLSAEHRDVAHRLRNALTAEGFRLVFQPIVSLQGDSRENYAVLIRLPLANDQEIAPEIFLPVADIEGLMTDIDRWVIQHALEELSNQRHIGNRAHFFIVMSEHSIAEAQTLKHICDALEKYEIKGNWVTFSFHESNVRRQLKSFRVLIEGLKRMSCGISIDHFGLLPKPELLLQHLPIDFVKFDRSLLKDLSKDPVKQKTLANLQTLAATHHTKCIALGVEDANSLAILWTHGISYTQGYFLQEPSEVIQYGISPGG